MTEVISGGLNGVYIYWGRSDTFAAGDPTTETHQAFNPMVGGLDLALPQSLYDLIPHAADLYPQIEVDKELEPNTITFGGYFRDIFGLLALFTYKTASSPWTGTSDTITAGFSNRDNVDSNIWTQLRVPTPSGSNNVDLFLDGGKIVEYRLIGENQGGVREEIDIKFAEVLESTTACDIDDGFDDGAFDQSGIDGGWSYWDQQLYTGSEDVLVTIDVTPTVGGSAIPGLAVQDWELIFPVPNAYEFIASSRTAGISYEEVRGPWVFNATGKLKDSQDISEAIAALSSKTKSTVKLAWDSSPFEKYIQFTNGVLKNIDGLAMPEAGAPIEVTYVYEGAASSVLTLSYTVSESTDPRTHINYTGT